MSSVSSNLLIEYKFSMLDSKQILKNYIIKIADDQEFWKENFTTKIHQ